MPYLLDTNIIAEPTKLPPNANVLKALAQHSGQISISSVSWHELWFGTDRLPPSRKRQILETYLNNLSVTGMPILPYTEAAGRWFATERSRLTSIGLIAAVNNLILVTRNVADFIHFDGSRVENRFD
jgi:tRNA(fMet)-specific endonuclease VapC